MVTAELLNEYKEMIANTAVDLEELLDAIDNNMKGETLQVASALTQNDDFEENEAVMKEERASIQQCLKICENVSTHIDQVQANTFADISTPSGEHRATTRHDRISLPQVTTSRTLESCKRGLSATYSLLKMQLDDLNDRIAETSQQEGILNAEGPGSQSTKEQVDSIKQCLAICTQATEEIVQDRVNVFEDVNMADDGHQIIVATLGDLISAKRITVGARSTQWLGQMSDTSLQQLSQNHSSVAEGTRPDTEVGAIFEGRHGAGRKLR